MIKHRIPFAPTTPEKTGVIYNGRTLFYRQMREDIRKAMDDVHGGVNSGLKFQILSQIDIFLQEDNNIGCMLSHLRVNGRKIFLLTNSDFEFTKAIMSFLLGREWRSFFDFVLVDAKKPAWFSGSAAFNEVDVETCQIGGPANSLHEGAVYSGGSCDVFRRLLNAKRKQVLYVGDHIYGDVLRSKVADDPLNAFFEWLVYQLPLAYDTFAYSHFGGRFDMVIVFRELFRRGFNPEMLRKGNKMYEMKVKKQKKRNPNIVFRDSFNLMPMALAALVPSFGLDVEEKPFFPHLSNNPCNYGRQIFPTPNDYLANGMMPEKRRQFDNWYHQHQNEPFLLDEALAAYCTNDVDILTAALVAFRREFFEISRRQEYVDGVDQRENHDGIDALKECMTIAGACMKYFRTNHLPAGHLAIVPGRGYDNAQNQSRLALRFFHWYAEEYGVEVQTAHSAGGEKRVGQYSLDGWIETEKRAIEVNGCVWHGCPKCYPSDNMLMPSGKPAGEVRERDRRRLEFVRSQVARVDVYWECEIERMLSRSKEMRIKFSEYVDDGPLEIRAAFMGRRTGPLKLFHKADEGEKISYYDFTSLYPYINFITRYPIGQPKVHVLNQDVTWTYSADNPFPLALLKVWVVPPQQCDVPVLPVKVNERLCFPHCIQCAKEYPRGDVDQNYTCQHNDTQRGWVSTCTSIELNAALDEGYRVTKLFRALQYDNNDDQLFRPYIAEFMAQKIEASDFAANIKGNVALEQEFINECFDKFGITIDATKMAVNKGKRSIAKLCLNNLWGRFSLRNFGLAQTLITDDPTVLGEYLDNKTVDVMSIDELNETTILITYLTKKEWVEEHSCSNIVISLWITSAARLLLLKAMQTVKLTKKMEEEHGTFGSLFRTGPQITHFASQIGKYADLYATSYLNLLNYSRFQFFRAPMSQLPHESTEIHMTAMPDITTNRTVHDRSSSESSTPSDSSDVDEIASWPAVPQPLEAHMVED